MRLVPKPGAQLRTRADVVRFLLERLRQRRYPVPTHVAIVRRLVQHARLSRTGCILWPKAVNNCGYGKATIQLLGQGFQMYVHHLADYLGNNPNDMPHWQERAHTCDTPACFHPDHIQRQRRRDNRVKSAERTNAKKRGEIPRDRDVRRAA